MTLAELLVASVILSISLLGAYRAARSCLEAAEWVDRQSRTEGQLRRVFEQLARDLRCAIVDRLEDRSMIFVGRNEEGKAVLSFVCLPGDSLGWQPGIRSALRRVAYTAEEGNLIRSEQPLSGPDKSSSYVAVDGADHIAFRFFRAGEVLPQWSDEDKLPSAVEMTLNLNGVPHSAMIRIPSAQSAEILEEGEG